MSEADNKRKGYRLDIDDNTVEYSDATHRYLLDEIEEHGVGITGWEQGFINDYIVRGRKTFTPRQSEVLGMIFRKRVLGENE